MLEGVVFSRLIARSLKGKSLEIKKQKFIHKEKKKDELDISIKKELQIKLLEDAGIIRNKKGLKAMVKYCRKYIDYKPQLEFQSIELSNMITLAKVISEKALERKESRGVHFRMDYPFQKESFKKHSFTRLGS